MHSKDVDGVTFHHNGGYLGEVKIVVGNQSLSVPFSAMLSLVADFLRDRKRNEVEDLSDEEILGIR
jgi:hypothetical protein